MSDLVNCELVILKFTTMSDKNKADYTPYGEEWEKHIMKIPKRQLEQMFGISSSKISKEELVGKIKDKLNEDT